MELFFFKASVSKTTRSYVKLVATDMEKSAKVMKKDEGPQNDNQIQKFYQPIEHLLIYLSFYQGLHMLVEKGTLSLYYVFL